MFYFENEKCIAGLLSAGIARV